MMAGDLLPNGLLEIMQCPRCHSVLDEDAPAGELVCRGSGHRFPVTSGIPDMMVEADGHETPQADPTPGDGA